MTTYLRIHDPEKRKNELALNTFTYRMWYAKKYRPWLGNLIPRPMIKRRTWDAENLKSAAALIQVNTVTLQQQKGGCSCIIEAGVE